MVIFEFEAKESVNIFGRFGKEVSIINLNINYKKIKYMELGANNNRENK